MRNDDITSVFSQTDGLFHIDGLRDAEYQVRARLMGQRDEWFNPLATTMEPATGEELKEQRPATSAFGMMKFENLKDNFNFKMMCSYCHQIGILGSRTPVEPVDWETMIKRMDDFGRLYRRT
ncbi:MAG: hypothetical protein M2R45_05131 [Verrucomicrobia subdivision 3 bacterium]|nr:hypothetical protein [Limisphaerales bacterium]MCS1417193.1 hypothetical protein [Limisphaerales bacterium]